MKLDKFGEYKPTSSGNCCGCGLCLKVCPFNGNDENEDTLAHELYAKAPDITYEPFLGYFEKCFVGHVADQKQRLSSASGGLASFILRALLESACVDRIITATPTNQAVPLFEFQVVSSAEALDIARGSIYYPLQMAEVLREVIAGPEIKYAITTLPCFAKAIRSAQQINPNLKRRIKYVLGLACGGCPNAQFTELLSCIAGMPGPQRVEYRNDQQSKRANDYRFVCYKGDSRGHVALSSVFGFMWMNKLFFHHACDLCDDVFGEVADITFMDAWLKEYLADPKGTSLVICRNRDLRELMETHNESGALSTHTISEKSVVESQLGVIQHKRAELGARLCLAAKPCNHVPVKRIPPAIESQTERIETLKSILAIQERVKQDWNIFQKQSFLAWHNSLLLRFKTSVFCLKLYSSLKQSGFPIKGKWDMLLPEALVSILRNIRSLLT